MTCRRLSLENGQLPTRHGFKVLSAKLGYKARNPIDPASLSAEQREDVEAFLAAMDGNDNVHQPAPAISEWREAAPVDSLNIAMNPIA